MSAQTIAVALVHILAKVLGQALGFSYGVPDSPIDSMDTESKMSTKTKAGNTTSSIGKLV